MSKFKKFDEYLTARGALVATPSVVQVPDYTGPDPDAPPVQKVKGIETPKGGKPSKYKTTTRAIAAAAGEKGLVNAGPKAAPYPKTTGDHHGTKMPRQWPTESGTAKIGQKVAKTQGRPVETWPKDYHKGLNRKTKTEQFIDATKDMNLAEFTNYMLKECGCGGAPDLGEDDTLPMVTAYATGKFHPHPPEAIRYVVALAKANPRIMENLIHEIKRADGLSDMLGATLDHPESYDMLTDLLGDDEKGPKHTKALARSMDDKYSRFMDEQEGMYESVAPPYGDDMEDDEEDEDDLATDDDAVDDSGIEDDGLDHPDDEEMEDDGMDDGEEDLDGEMGDEEMPLPDDQGVDHPDDTEQSPGLGEELPEEQPKKLKKKFAHDHMLDAMGEYDHMREKMKGYVR